MSQIKSGIIAELDQIYFRKNPLDFLSPKDAKGEILADQKTEKQGVSKIKTITERD